MILSQRGLSKALSRLYSWTNLVQLTRAGQRNPEQSGERANSGICGSYWLLFLCVVEEFVAGLLMLQRRFHEAIYLFHEDQHRTAILISCYMVRVKTLRRFVSARCVKLSQYENDRLEEMIHDQAMRKRERAYNGGVVACH